MKVYTVNRLYSLRSKLLRFSFLMLIIILLLILFYFFSNDLCYPMIASNIVQSDWIIHLQIEVPSELL